MLDRQGRIGHIGTVNYTRQIIAQQAVSNTWGVLPAVAVSEQELVEEFLKVIVRRLLVQIMPFLRVVNAEPGGIAADC